MAERIMTEKQIKAHSERIAKMRKSMRLKIKEGKASASALRKKTRSPKGVDPDKTKEFETRFNNIWVAIKRLESRIIQLESKEG